MGGGRLPFCTACGAGIEPAHRFCRACGAPQPAAEAPSQLFAGFPGLSPRAASILCYIPWLGWIASVFVLASESFRTARDVRFHAYQGLYLFVAWLLVHWVVRFWQELLPGPSIPLDKILELLILVLWILMLIKTSRGERHSLPILGDLAERSL
jgi:uncharacterized membrane protein